MSSTAATRAPLPKDWVAIAFLTLTPLVGIVGTAWYTWRVGFEPWMLVLLVVMYALVGLSICAGYHRYFSHKTYECAPAVQAFYAVFGAMAAQSTILDWCSGHRRHHRHVDEDWDPYNIKRGFWWSHILWIFEKYDPSHDNVPDLLRNPVVRWQYRWTNWLMIGGGFGIPTFIGWLCGDAWAGLLWGGFARVVVCHHTTFFVNSAAHHFGSQSFDHEVSARDNWIVALLTLGEGYHSFHHRFPGDYRNGIRWYQWDPAKWFIAALRAVGLAEKLKVTPDDRIESARMAAAVAEMQARLDSAPHGLAAEVGERLQAARTALARALELRRRELRAGTAGARRRVRAMRLLARRELREARRHWRDAVRLLAAATQQPA
jgi:stearoyl-CoA desaturase (Delta-9 desaturase)